MILIPVIGALLVVIGTWAMLTRKNLIKIVLGFSIVDTGVHLLIVSIGFIRSGTAPIVDADAPLVGTVFVDPVPSALVLTAIVIGLAVTAVMLSYVVRLGRSGGSLDIGSFKELRW